MKLVTNKFKSGGLHEKHVKLYIYIPLITGNTTGTPHLKILFLYALQIETFVSLDC